MTPRKFSEKHRVVYYETDLNNRLKLSTLLNVIILASEDQNRSFKLNPRLPFSFGTGWVVVQYSIQINRLPKNDETVNLSTVSPRYNSLFAERDFQVTDQQGRNLVSVDSRWVTLNLKTRKLALISPKETRIYGSRKVSFIPSLPRPKEIKGEPSTVRKYRVRYSDIDVNHHVNNSHYLDWMMDVLTPHFLMTHHPKQIQLKFRNEVQYGDVITSRVQKVKKDDNLVLTRHEIDSHDHLATVANIIWENNEN